MANGSSNKKGPRANEGKTEAERRKPGKPRGGLGRIHPDLGYKVGTDVKRGPGVQTHLFKPYCRHQGCPRTRSPSPDPRRPRVMARETPFRKWFAAVRKELAWPENRRSERFLDSQIPNHPCHQRLLPSRFVYGRRSNRRVHWCKTVDPTVGDEGTCDKTHEHVRVHNKWFWAQHEESPLCTPVPSPPPSP
jgi:hypothetical protein